MKHRWTSTTRLGCLGILLPLCCGTAACETDVSDLGALDEGSSSTACGNGELDADESCDDGNRTPGDGCSADCELVTGYVCPEPGEPCAAVEGEACGDGELDAGEECDDGDTEGGDGCRPDCSAITPGFACPVPGQPCVAVEDDCGDGVVSGDEECDDGVNEGDGCLPGCVLPDATCGDGVLDPGEVCDDFNALSGDGCAADCLSVEPGYTCTAGEPCLALCGDGLVGGEEECDLGAENGGADCTNDCRLPT